MKQMNHKYLSDNKYLGKQFSYNDLIKIIVLLFNRARVQKKHRNRRTYQYLYKK